MRKRISELLLEIGIDCFGFLPLSACTVQKKYLLERTDISDGSVVIFAMPYYTHSCDNPKNISAYAVGKDYHLFFKQISDRLLQTLREEFPKNCFAAFADHSPIDERRAAAMAGLGVLGKNGLLITEKYSSYVFLGEIFTDAALGVLPQKIDFCEACGACERVCPLRLGETSECLSAVTQRKTPLSPQEENALLAHKTVWGCDLCQEVCPHTVQAKKTGRSIHHSASLRKTRFRSSRKKHLPPWTTRHSHRAHILGADARSFREISMYRSQEMISPHRPLLRTSRKKRTRFHRTNVSESFSERSRNSHTLTAKNYLFYLSSLLQKTQFYHLWHRYLAVFRKFRLISLLFRIYSYLLVFLQFGTAFFFLALASLLLVPILMFGAGFVAFSALLLYRRENDRMQKVLEDKDVIVFFPTLGGELSEGDFWRAHVEELARRADTEILVVSPHFWSGKGIGDNRFYLLLRKEREDLYLLRKHYYFSLKRAVLDKSQNRISFIY